MARKPMVTRTFKTTECVVLAINMETEEACNYSVTLPRTYADEKKLFKAVEKTNTDENIKPVKVVSTNIIEQLYGMDEQKFLENAEILPPRNAETSDNE